MCYPPLLLPTELPGWLPNIHRWITRIDPSHGQLSGHLLRTGEFTPFARTSFGLTVGEAPQKTSG